MARESFKRRLGRFLPVAAERSTFISGSGVMLALVIAAWQPLPGTVWEGDSRVGSGLLWGLYALGWGYLFAATIVTNHFELMGLRQTCLHFVNRPYTALPFVRKWRYRHSRHPMILSLPDP